MYFNVDQLISLLFVSLTAYYAWRDSQSSTDIVTAIHLNSGPYAMKGRQLNLSRISIEIFYQVSAAQSQEYSGKCDNISIVCL